MYQVRSGCSCLGSGGLTGYLLSSYIIVSHLFILSKPSFHHLSKATKYYLNYDIIMPGMQQELNQRKRYVNWKIFAS